MLDVAMMTECSPNMHPVLVQAIVKTESNYNPFAIGVNRGNRLTRQPRSFGEAVLTAKRLLSQGVNIDLGLGQINSNNLNWLNLSVEQAFTPCANLQALQKVYLACYDKAGNTGFGDRVQRAFSCYNTGNLTKGFSNGYVTKATNNLNDLIARATNSDQYLTQTTHTIKNAHINAVEPQKADLGINIPPKAQNANMSVSVRSDSHLNNQPPIPENIQAENVPVRVHNSWDIFGDF